MNRKTINKILTKKHEDFLSSITNEEVKKLIDKNSIITGGSIVSLLLNEKVNDYDYYFTDKEINEYVDKQTFLKNEANKLNASKAESNILHTHHIARGFGIGEFSQLTKQKGDISLSDTISLTQVQLNESYRENLEDNMQKYERGDEIDRDNSARNRLMDEQGALDMIEHDLEIYGRQDEEDEFMMNTDAIEAN